MGNSVWSRKNVLAFGAFKDHIKSTFQRRIVGRPAVPFNAGLEAKKARAIGLHEGDTLSEFPH
jgi:hypothetical protein